MEHQDRSSLTSAEIGKLWATYMGNTMAKCVLSYFQHHTEDEDIKRVVGTALNFSERLIVEIKDIFKQENFPVPAGFSDEDVNLDAPRLFADELYLHYLKYTGKAGVSIYSIAIPLMTKKNIRDFFINALNSTVKLITEVNDVLMEKGFYIKPPLIPIPENVDFVKKQNYLNGFLGDVRPLHALEISHLYDNIENNVTSKALLIAFSQVAKMGSIERFMLRGKEITSKHIENCIQQLHNDNLPALLLLDNLVSTSTIAPFSDKLMLWHKIDMFSMKIRTYANAASLNGRRDIGAMYARFLLDISLYVEDGANIMIDQGWMEKVPQAADRKKLK
ncbi:DUF3231 family protein [Bacillus sp. S/N-304-OC-R1]|uniref:DUF3231 family protein n=1 Tax=Bacillus sp. S/N-304-OC-R1 TaxID=2758034 RepID=UPI001C8F0A3C|nr:DUF3231 family protein [Bacillus sp. S/N-304-OC-R1]MBY0122481.1 DUF3231 family protein [Bacillus sp. S/N-304-OC-R1]